MERRIVLGGRAWVNGDVRTLSSAPITRVLGRALIVEPSSLVQSVLLELPDNSEPSALAKKPSCLKGLWSLQRSWRFRTVSALARPPNAGCSFSLGARGL